MSYASPFRMPYQQPESPASVEVLLHPLSGLLMFTSLTPPPLHRIAHHPDACLKCKVTNSKTLKGLKKLRGCKGLEGRQLILGAADAGEDDKDPYWARPWPSATALAAQLLGSRPLVAGRTAADVGCGCGLAGLAAAAAGATRPHHPLQRRIAQKLAGTCGL